MGSPITVSYPFHDVGIAAWISGAAIIIILASSIIIRRQRAKAKTAIIGPASNTELVIAAASGLVLLVLESLLSQIDLEGPPVGPFSTPSYQVYPYGPFALYLELYGMAILLFAVFAFFSRQRVAAIFLSVGTVICGLSLDLLSIAYYEDSVHPSGSFQTPMDYMLAVGLSFVIVGSCLIAWQRHDRNKRELDLIERSKVPASL